jgi:SAM-dependent methyltransferase
VNEKPSLAPPAYDPATYWDAKARRAQGDASRAVCMDDPLENLCIDRIQRRLIPDAIRQSVLPGNRPGDRALDFGCGTGRWMKFLTDSGYAYSGVDISREVIALAKKAHPKSDLQAFDGLHVSDADNSFSLVMSIGVIHHNQYHKQDEIIRELIRVTKPGGYLILFEGIGPRAQEGVVEYPRSLANWRETFESHDLQQTYTRKARYWILRSLYYDFAENRLAKLRLNSAFWPRLALKCDTIVDPYLQRLLPLWYVTRALMIFRKP